MKKGRKFPAPRLRGQAARAGRLQLITPITTPSATMMPITTEGEAPIARSTPISRRRSITMSLNVMERRREMGVLRAIGASPSVVMGIIVAEGVVIGVMSWILAALAAGPLSRGAGNFLPFFIFKSRLDSVFELQGLCIWLAFSALSAGAASLLPARFAAKLTVREALAYE